MYSVYWIRHADHSDIFSQGYVGISKDFKQRMSSHKRRTNTYLKHAIQKYSWDALVKEVVLIADEKYCLDIELKLRPEDKIGWNLTKGGGKPPINLWNAGTKGVMKSWNKGKKLPPETVEKIRNNVKNLWLDPAYRQHMSNAHKGKASGISGKKHSIESIERMRAAKIGKPSKKKGKLLTDAQKANLSNLIRQNPWNCPYCQKVGYNIGAGNRWHFDNCKQKE